MWEGNVNDTAVESFEFLLYKVIRVIYLQIKGKATLGWHLVILGFVVALYQNA